jgi:hypothetical protein
MARPLQCPYCLTEFPFADWQRAASCPSCGRPLSFFEASGAVVPSASGGATNAPAAGAGAASRVTTIPTFGNKPLQWTRGWTVVVAVWIIVAVALGLARIELGHLTALSARESKAIAQLRAAPLEDGVTYGQALQLVRQRFELMGGTPQWYVNDRSWERQVWIEWDMKSGLGDVLLLWHVGYDGAVHPDPDTLFHLKDLVRQDLRPAQ